jgi:hypothetical protein
VGRRMTKKQLIDALLNLDVPDDTIVVMASGIGFEDVRGVELKDLVSSTYKKDDEFPAIILN